MESASKKAKTDAAHNNNTTMILTEPTLTRVLLLSGFLTPPQMGRLVLWTSKTCKDAFVSSSWFWKTLCLQYWRNDDATVQALLATTGLSAEQLFRQIAMTHPNSARATIRPLQYQPADYVLVVEVRDAAEGALVFCQAVPGQDIPSFFQDATCRVALTQGPQQVVVLPPRQEYNEQDPQQELPEFQFSAKGYLIRTTTTCRQILPVTAFEDNCQREVILGHPYDDDDDDDDDLSVCYDWSSGSLPNLASTRMLELGAAIANAKHGLDYDVERDGFSPVTLKLELHYCRGRSKDGEDATLMVSHFSTFAWIDVHDSDSIACLSFADVYQPGVVTFAHVLEANDKWEPVGHV